MKLHVSTHPTRLNSITLLTRRRTSDSTCGLFSKCKRDSITWVILIWSCASRGWPASYKQSEIPRKGAMLLSYSFVKTGDMPFNQFSDIPRTFLWFIMFLLSLSWKIFRLSALQCLLYPDVSPGCVTTFTLSSYASQKMEAPHGNCLSQLSGWNKDICHMLGNTIWISRHHWRG